MTGQETVHWEEEETRVKDQNKLGHEGMLGKLGFTADNRYVGQEET